MNPLLIILLILLFLSGLALIVTVLLHSGKGAGLSDIIAGQVYSNISSTGIVQKNLDRLTIVCAIVFFLCVIGLMFVYPQGSVNPQGNSSSSTAAATPSSSTDTTDTSGAATSSGTDTSTSSTATNDTSSDTSTSSKSSDQKSSSSSSKSSSSKDTSTSSSSSSKDSSK